MLDLKNRPVIVTGGSAGLGLSIAEECVRRGAHVAIIARRAAALESAVAHLRTLTVSAAQSIGHATGDCSDAAAISAAIASAQTSVFRGQAPYMVVCNAGTSVPRYFLDLSPGEIDGMMRTNYLSASYTAHAALRSMVAAAEARGPDAVAEGKLVFVSSAVAMIGFAGYAGYAPTKAAINSLADCLRHELLGGRGKGIAVHTFMPGTIDTPGFAEEQRIKPELTRRVEADDEVMPPAKCAQIMFAGLDSGRFQITTNFNSELLRVARKCHAPANNPVVDFIYYLIAWFGIIGWRVLELDALARKMPAIPFGTRAAAAAADANDEHEKAPLTGASKKAE
ncbi:3-dehydrosphinganine reductase [Blastocladiella emersonii ATCC 22665]|nr:3-dehydrosphinganine reductase [Blastocladiella emersonii ATCC 22665]